MRWIGWRLAAAGLVVLLLGGGVAVSRHMRTASNGQGQASMIGDLAIAVGIPALVLGIALYIAGLVRDSRR